MCDILRGNGFLAEPTSNHPTNDVEVIFCNPDLLWKNEWEGPRLGQGGFRKAWEAVWLVGHPVFFALFIQNLCLWTAYKDGPEGPCDNSVREAHK